MSSWKGLSQCKDFKVKDSNSSERKKSHNNTNKKQNNNHKTESQRNTLPVTHPPFCRDYEQGSIHKFWPAWLNRKSRKISKCDLKNSGHKKKKKARIVTEQLPTQSITWPSKWWLPENKARKAIMSHGYILWGIMKTFQKAYTSTCNLMAGQKLSSTMRIFVKSFRADNVSCLLSSHLAVREPTTVVHKNLCSYFLTGCAQLHTEVKYCNE